MIARYCSLCGKPRYENKESRCTCYGRMWVTKEQYKKIKERVDRARRKDAN